MSPRRTPETLEGTPNPSARQLSSESLGLCSSDGGPPELLNCSSSGDAWNVVVLFWKGSRGESSSGEVLLVISGKLWEVHEDSRRSREV